MEIGGIFDGFKSVASMAMTHNWVAALVGVEGTDLIDSFKPAVVATSLNKMLNSTLLKQLL